MIIATPDKGPEACVVRVGGFVGSSDRKHTVGEETTLDDLSLAIRMNLYAAHC